MPLDKLILAFNTALTISIGAIAFFIIYGTYKNVDDDLVKEYSKRLLLVTVVLILFVFYWGVYNYSWKGIELAKYPIYLSIIFIFLYLIWSVITFEKIANKFGKSRERKIDEMGEEFEES